MSDLAIGVDVGGTKIAAALVNRAGETIAEHTQPTLPESGIDAVLERIVHAIENVRPHRDAVVGIGVGIPGPVNPQSGVSIMAANLGKAWRDVPLHDEISKRLTENLPIYIENDVNIGAIGEMTFGAARDCDDFVFAMLGTGLGGTAIINKRIILGATFSAMEIGHIVFRPDGRLCNCGQRGCVEMYASGKGIMAGYHQLKEQYPDSVLNRIDPTTTPDILNHARQVDMLASHVLNDAVNAFSFTLSWCTTIFNPSLVVIGGGLGFAAWDVLVEPAIQKMSEYVLPELARTVTFRRSKLQTSVLGAAALVWHRQEGK